MQTRKHVESQVMWTADKIKTCKREINTQTEESRQEKSEA